MSTALSARMNIQLLSIIRNVQFWLLVLKNVSLVITVSILLLMVLRSASRQSLPALCIKTSIVLSVLTATTPRITENLVTLYALMTVLLDNVEAVMIQILKLYIMATVTKISQTVTPIPSSTVLNVMMHTLPVSTSLIAQL